MGCVYCGLLLLRFSGFSQINVSSFVACPWANFQTLNGCLFKEAFSPTVTVSLRREGVDEALHTPILAMEPHSRMRAPG